MFTNVHLDDLVVPFVLATDTKALLLRPLIEPHDWLADEDGTKEHPDPTWFSTEYLIASPFYEIDKAAQILRNQEPTSNVQPIVVLCEGSILNPNAWKEYWHQRNGDVVLLKNGKADGLMTLEEFLEKS